MNKGLRGETCFATTHWSVVLAAGDSSAPGAKEALERLCRAYWYPLYALIRRQSYSPHDAQDLTQAFFASLLENRGLRVADPERGRFRSFLLARLKHFLSDELKRSTPRSGAAVRPLFRWMRNWPRNGSARNRPQELTPELIFDGRWALTVMEKPSPGCARSMSRRTGRSCSTH